MWFPCTCIVPVRPIAHQLFFRTSPDLFSSDKYFTNFTFTQIWASGRSTVGSGAEGRVYARNVPIAVNDVAVSPGDIAFCDPLEGVVIIPQALVDQVIDLMPKLVAADDKVKEDVEAGCTVHAAFQKHRT